MKREVIWVDGAILDEFHPQAKGLYADYTRSLEVVYTLGKTSEWNTVQGNDAVRGLTTHASIRAQARHLYGRFLIDVKACAADSSTSLSLSGIGGTMAKTAVNFYGLQRSVLTAFVHESFHVVQGWLLGGIEAIYRRNADHYWKTRFLPAEGSYRSNPIEAAAFDSEKNIGREINRRLGEGEFNKIFSLALLNAVAAGSKR